MLQMFIASGKTINDLGNYD